MMAAIIENNVIEQLTRKFLRSPFQRNRTQESDAEIIEIVAGGPSLAVTTDTIAEEIALGLYSDPYLAGWMVVMANMSDLAAVGAVPVGILLSELFPGNFSQEDIERLQQGIQDACNACNTFVLGGDTNLSDKLILTGCAIGTVPAGTALSRCGIQPGDLVYSTGKLGLGNAFAFSFLAGKPLEIPVVYKPSARLLQGQTIREIATACMDTSDGMLATIDQLMRLNGVGFRIDADLESYVHADAVPVAGINNFSPWLTLAGQHGEFELLFTVPPAKEAALRMAAAASGWYPVRIGTVVEQPEIHMTINNKLVRVPGARIRNLASNADHDVGAYLQALFALDKEIQKGVLVYDAATL